MGFQLAGSIYQFAQPLSVPKGAIAANMRYSLRQFCSESAQHGGPDLRRVEYGGTGPPT
jgi:hypothetical protein